jgi:hypothetical protein
MDFVSHMSYGGGATETVLHPVMLAAMVLAIILMFVLPRRYVVLPFLYTVILFPHGQQLLVAGAHLYVCRILILAGCLRLCWDALAKSKKVFGGGFTVLDMMFLSWAIIEATANIMQLDATGAVVNQAGFLLDALGGYFLLRYCIEDEESIERVIKVFAISALICGLMMLREHFTGIDTLGFMGGIRDVLEVRNGTPRAEGPFAHALLAGAFGATLPPLMLWLWKSGKTKFIAGLGMLGCTLMASLTMCSTPVLTYVLAIGAICLWPVRGRMRLLRWGIVFTCLAFQLVMKAPFWFVLAHIDLTGSSNGWYRAALVDQFLRHIDQWWLFGTTANREWANGAMWDACNQFVFEGTVGGIVPLVFFIAILCVCFSKLGKARRAAEGNTKREWLFWLLGVTLFAHVTSFFGTDYHDQMRFVWYAFLAVIAVAVAVPAPATVPVISAPPPIEVSPWDATPDELALLAQEIPEPEAQSGPDGGGDDSYPMDFRFLRSK